MAVVVFDTLILSRKLAAAGMPVDQAQGVAAAIAETLGEQIATRRDIDDVRRDVAELRGATKRDVEDVRRDLTARIDQMEVKLSAQIDLLRADLRQSEQRQTIRLGLMLAGGLAVVATLVKLL